MFSTDFIFRQQENLVDNQKCQARFRPLCNKILLLTYAPYVSLLAQHIFYLIVKARLIIYGQMYYDKTILELMKH